FFFFFSSRRRHTRFSRDWSSDVCSSDLVDKGLDAFPLDSLGERLVVSSTLVARILVQPGMGADRQQREDPLRPPRRDVEGEPSEIGRASCRERGESAWGAVACE